MEDTHGTQGREAARLPSHAEAAEARAPGSTREGALVFDPFAGSGTTAVAAKELNRFFVGAELEKEFAELAARRVGATERGSVLREISPPGRGR